MMTLTMMTMKMTKKRRRCFYEVTCDSCGQKLNVSEDVLLEGEIECPNCGELLEFDFSDIFDGEECDPADCEGCGSNCNSSEE